MSKIPKSVSDYMASIGGKGGKTTGETKVRDPAHYKRLADLKRAAAAKRAKAAK